jgi:hypothetical protein
MSIQAVAWALEQDLPARPKLVLVSIANHANHKDGYCWLRIDTIAEEASCSPRGVFNFIGDLVRNGYIRKAPRKGEDGKQRANDYWILLDREPADWVSDRSAAGDEDAAEASADDAAEPQDVVEPHAPGAVGETGDKAVENPPRHPVEKPVRAVGPHAPACSRIDSEEPSKTKPKITPIGERPPRGYARPPAVPPPAQGSTTSDGSSAPIFVFVGTPAYDAWARYREAERRAQGDPRPFRLRTCRQGDWGWYFPTLFPPQAQAPPEAQQTTEDDINPFEKVG